MRLMSLKLSVLWIQGRYRARKWEEAEEGKEERETVAEIRYDSSMPILYQSLTILKIISVFLFWHTPKIFLVIT